MLLVLALFLMPVDAKFVPCPRTLTSLAAARDCYRPLLLFAPSADDPQLKAQILELRTHEKDLLDRDVAVAIILPNHATRPENLPFTRLSLDDEAAAQQRFRADAMSFAIVLVGKDGGEKLQRKSILKVADLDRTIDAMPMRQQELLQKP